MPKIAAEKALYIVKSENIRIEYGVFFAYSDESYE
jgi:hypothetical protein